jgi:dihydropteroate synthase
MTSRTYLHPIDLRYGEEVPTLVTSGLAAPLAGLGIAFAAVERIVRTGDGVERQRVSLQEAARDPAFANLTAPRAIGRPQLMGILNVTPDSFSRESRHPLVEDAVAHGLALADAGADIVDVGGESTRPGAGPVAAEEELRRVLPVVRRLAGAGVTVSIDTRKARVMAEAVAAGARIINDVSGLTHDPEAPAAAAASGAGVILMHLRDEPRTMNRAPSYRHAALEVYDELEERLARALAAGIPRKRVMLDPGLCFAKHEPHNVDVLRHLALYHGLGCPLLLGASRKGWTALLHERWRPEQRLPGTLAAGFWALQKGVVCLRVHDLDAHRQLLEAWRALGGA